MGVAVGGSGLGVCVGRVGVRTEAGSAVRGSVGGVGVLGAGSGDAGADQQAAVSAPASAQAPSEVSRRLATSNPLSLRWDSCDSSGMFRCPVAAVFGTRGMAAVTTLARAGCLPGLGCAPSEFGARGRAGRRGPLIYRLRRRRILRRLRALSRRFCSPLDLKNFLFRSSRRIPDRCIWVWKRFRS